MEIKINGEVTHTEQTSLQQIIDNFGAKPPYALAVNGEFVPKSQYQKYQLKNNDAVDIVSPIFGG